jgi:hypothetical protein
VITPAETVRRIAALYRKRAASARPSFVRLMLAAFMIGSAYAGAAFLIDRFLP